MRKISEQINLSAREKRMLYFLLCFLLVMGGWFFLLKPQLDKGNELNLELLDTQIEHDNLQQTLLEYQVAPQKLEEVRAAIQSIKNKYNTFMVNEDVDRLITTLYLQHGLDPISLSIGEITPLQLDTEDNVESGMAQMPIQMVASGQLYQLTAALDALQTLNGIKVAGFSYAEPIDPTQIPTGIYDINIYLTNE